MTWPTETKLKNVLSAGTIMATYLCDEESVVIVNFLPAIIKHYKA
jgi:hypothetical protein